MFIVDNKRGESWLIAILSRSSVGHCTSTASIAGRWNPKDDTGTGWKRSDSVSSHWHEPMPLYMALTMWKGVLVKYNTWKPAIIIFAGRDKQFIGSHRRLQKLNIVQQSTPERSHRQSINLLLVTINTQIPSFLLFLQRNQWNTFEGLNELSATLQKISPGPKHSAGTWSPLKTGCWCTFCSVATGIRQRHEQLYHEIVSATNIG